MSDKTQCFAQPHPIIFKYSTCCACHIVFNAWKKDISLRHNAISFICIPLLQVRKMMIIKYRLNWCMRVFFRQAVITFNPTSREWVASQTIIGLVKQLTSWMPWIWFSLFPESDIPVTSTQLEGDSPARFARIGVENKGTASTINQQIICL